MIDCGTTTETGIESDHTAVKLKIRMRNIPKKITSTKSPKNNEEQTNSKRKIYKQTGEC